MKRIFLVSLIMMISGIILGNVSFSYNLNDPSITRNGDYSSIKLDGALLLGSPGEPALPWFGVKLLIPVGYEASEIKIIRSNPKTYQLTEDIAPMQAQYPLSQEVLPPMVGPDTDIYSSNDVYPKDLHNGTRTEFLSGHPIAFSAVSPFEYYPLSRELIFYSSITVEIDYRPTERSSAALSLLKESSHIMNQLRSSVDNQSDIPYYQVRNEGIEYLVIGDAAKQANWQPLLDLYALRGLSVCYQSIQNIQATSTGADLQEKIRNYLTEIYTTNSLMYVLFAGDSDLIPHRGFYVNMGGGSQVDNDIPADMYYNCLDGNWNTDGDNYWGETYETDMVPEFALGRICYNNDQEIQNQIAKIFGYLMSPVESTVKSSLFVGEWLWDGPTWGGDYMDEMIGGASTHGYTTVGVPTSWNISTLYDRTYGYEEAWGSNQIRPLLSQGPNLVNHLGHSNTTYNMRLSNNQVSTSTITNDGATNNFSIYFTQGCYAGSFDNRGTSSGSYGEDCISEKFTALANAAVGMISHSRYGWGMQGSTDGASQYLHRQYIDAIFGEEIYELGYTLVDTKIDVIPFINQQPVMYWVLFETNLFGDPAMMIWTDDPQYVNAQLPAYWTVGMNNYQIQTNAPNASFRLRNNADIIYDTQADGTGMINVNLLNSLDPGQYQIYITAPNFYSYESSIIVTAGQMPYIVCSLFDTDSPNQLHLTNSVYSLDINVKNVGMSDQQSSGTLSLTSNSPNITVLSDPISFNSIASGDSTLLDAQFQIAVTGTFPDESLARMTFDATYDTYSSQSSIVLQLNAPNLQIEGYQINNDNYLIMPGDNPSVSLTLQNTGSGIAQSPMMLILSNDPQIQTSIMDLYTQPIMPGETVTIPDAFSFTVSEDIQIGSFAEIDYVLLTENDAEDNGSISFHIGMINYGFEPDWQNWESTVLSANFVNQWHRNSYRNYTTGGVFSAKFGGTDSGSYANSAFGALVSPPMALGLNSELKFFHWMDAETHTTYGYCWDGGIVEMSLNGGEWTHISPIGGYPYRIYNNPASPFDANTYCYSGSHGWQEASFDLSAYTGSVQIRFVFGSDGYTTGEGWYIDDVHIQADPIVSNLDPSLAPAQLQLLGNYPNPFNPTTTISFYSPASSSALLEIFNLRGQLIKSIQLDNLEAGKHSIVWDGLDKSNRTVSSGVYYYRIKAGDQEQGSRMLLMK